MPDYSEINPAWGDRQPVIIGFLCNWCSYRAADLAGTSRFGYPATLRDIRIMCTGRLDPTFVIKALRDGADGVLVMGCHPGQCHTKKVTTRLCGAWRFYGARWLS